MEVIPILGPLGAGKTTTLNGLIEHVPIGESYAVVVNDVGSQNIDARRIMDHPANRSERIIALTAGCIGCSDVTQFRDALKKVEDAEIDVLFIEPTGIAPGNEIVDVIRGEGHNTSVLTLVNARTIARDMKWQVLPSQLEVASIVGITHAYDEDDELTAMGRVLDSIPNLQSDVALKLIHPNEISGQFLAELRGVGPQYRLGKNLLDVCDITVDHDHHDHGTHNHGVVAQSLAIKSGTKIEDIKNILMPLTVSNTEPLLRAKGVIGDLKFDIVGDEWSEVELESSQLNNINVIFGGDKIPQALSAIDKFVDNDRSIHISGDKKKIVKSINESLSIEERSEIVLERIGQYPSPISALHGELITDCEADEGYELAYWGNNDLPEDLKAKAINAYINFRLDGLHELQHHSSAISGSEERRSYWARRYGASLGYNGYYLAENIVRIDELREVNPAQLLLAGFMDINTLAFDEGRAEEKPEFLLSVFSKALEYNHVKIEDVIQLFDHAIALSSVNEEYCDRYKKALQQILETNK